MMELSFHQELYDGFAVDEATKLYGPFATMELAKETDRFVVKVTATADALAQGLDERTICSEMANYVLGKTIENMRSDKAGAGAADGGAA